MKINKKYAILGAVIYMALLVSSFVTSQGFPQWTEIIINVMPFSGIAYADISMSAIQNIFMFLFDLIIYALVIGFLFPLSTFLNNQN
jgi:hypothetical protein